VSCAETRSDGYRNRKPTAVKGDGRAGGEGGSTESGQSAPDILELMSLVLLVPDSSDQDTRNRSLSRDGR
jgi:hypothetical protein